MYNLRPYQQEAVDAIWSNLDKHCVVSLPTGSGKSPIIAELVRMFLTYPGTHILILTHKRELIRQNMEHLDEHLPLGVDTGVYCAGLRSKELRQVTLASIQSLANAETLPPFEIILVDEAHLIPKSATGQYRKLFERLPEARIIGLTATPFRMNGGMLHEGKEKLFDALVYEAKTGDLIDQGYLSPIRSRATAEQANLSGVHTRGGEFIEDEMIAAMDQEKVNNAAVQDVLTHASDRKSILVFCAGIEHARHIESAFRIAGQTSIATVTEETTMFERDDATTRFKAKTLRILINVGVYTTGFNAPGVDCIVLLRATKSPGLYVQIVGRGLRKAEGKTNALLLDYGGNIERHGPIDMITAKSVKGGGVAPVKTCPECGTICFAGFAACPECGFIFPKNEDAKLKHGVQASDLDPVKPTVITEYEVNSVAYRKHIPKELTKTPSLRVLYQISMWQNISEWVCIEHTGYAKSKASAWFARRGVCPMPKTIDEALNIAYELPQPSHITVKRAGKYDEIIGYKWEKKQEKEVENLPF